MANYLKLSPDTDWRHRCRHRGGDPDCSCFPECPECGTVYTPTDGHDCLDDVPADELLDAAKELRDALAACETERDRLRTEVARLREIALSDDVRGMLSSHGSDGTILVVGEFSSGREFCEKFRLSAQVVEMPELTEEECEEILRSFPASLPAWEDGNWSLAFAKVVELVRARLVPTPPQDATGAQITFSQPETSPYLICDHCGGEMALTDGWVPTYSNPDNQGCNPSAEPYCPKCDAPHPLQPEERRVGPDEVVVGREEWEAVQEFADLIVPIRDNLSGISWIGKLSDVFAAYDRWYAVRISAQAHNGEESK